MNKINPADKSEITGLDLVEGAERTHKLEEIPHYSKRDEKYVHKNPSPDDDMDYDFAEGDLVGYDSEGDLWVVKTEGWEYHDLEGNQTEGETYLGYTSEALNLEVAGYLSPQGRLHGNNFADGEELFQLAKHNLEEVDRKLRGERVRVV